MNAASNDSAGTVLDLRVAVPYYERQRTSARSYVIRKACEDGWPASRLADLLAILDLEGAI